jgi:hypothetical protein
MLTAIVSVMTGIPLRREVAMTGEITLRVRYCRSRLEGEAARGRTWRHEDGADPRRERERRSSAAVATSRQGHRSPRSGRERQHRRWGRSLRRDRLHFLDNRKQRHHFQKKPVFAVGSLGRQLGRWGCV